MKCLVIKQYNFQCLFLVFTVVNESFIFWKCGKCASKIALYSRILQTMQYWVGFWDLKNINISFSTMMRSKAGRFVAKTKDLYDLLFLSDGFAFSILVNANSRKLHFPKQISEFCKILFSILHFLFSIFHFLVFWMCVHDNMIL